MDRPLMSVRNLALILILTIISLRLTGSATPAQTETQTQTRHELLQDLEAGQIEDAIRLCEQPREWTPATAAQFNEIRNALRAGRLG